MILERVASPRAEAVQSIVDAIADDERWEVVNRSGFRELDKIGASWTTFARQRLLEWSENEGPDIERLTQVVLENLDKRHGKLAGVPDAIRPVIKQWERERRSPTT